MDGSSGDRFEEVQPTRGFVLGGSDESECRNIIHVVVGTRL